jgi:hypothetical protein
MYLKINENFSIEKPLEKYNIKKFIKNIIKILKFKYSY